jgi:hypothetical protein
MMFKKLMWIRHSCLCASHGRDKSGPYGGRRQRGPYRGCGISTFNFLNIIMGSLPFLHVIPLKKLSGREEVYRRGRIPQAIHRRLLLFCCFRLL